MTDTLKELTATIDEIQTGVFQIPDDNRRHMLVSLLVKAYCEIDRLRESNSDMGWRLNPDRMGGQFSEEEMNRSGWL
jgi:hypothetical protein